jgi:PTH1 family peptidyl-tRNA hydrolase
MKVVVGLGNIGSRYAGTRHNLGFLVVDELSRDLKCAPFELDQVPARMTRGTVRTPEGDEPLLLVKPTTLMNGSGRAVGALARSGAAEFSPSDLLVVLDDVYLPFGRIRVRRSGSAGGHNGLKSVLEATGTTDMARLRCGVGPMPESADMVEFVLEDFSTAEKRALPEFVTAAASAARTCLEQGLQAAMNQFNSIEGVQP